MKTSFRRPCRVRKSKGAASSSVLSAMKTINQQIEAAGTTRLSAEDEVRLLAAANTTTQNNSQSSKSGSVGVGINLGAGGTNMGVTVSASRGTGQGAGSGTTYTQAEVSSDTVQIESGGDTTLKGAVVKADQVTATVGGDLLIETLQDSNRYNERSRSTGGSVTIGPAPGGSLNLSQTRINSTYQSTTEQSGIRAGDGGFQVNVAGNTTLTGGVITSSEQAVQAGSNQFTTAGQTAQEALQSGALTITDLQNHASYSARSTSVGLGAGAAQPGQSPSAALSGVGLGRDSGSASSTTQAAISGLAGNTEARTGDAATGIGPIFDQARVQREVAAQVAITQEFGKQASKAVGDYAKAQYDQARAAGDTEGMAAWEEGGKNRVALHTLVGGLTGGAQGAIGAGAASAAAPAIEALQAQLQTALADAGVGQDTATLIASLASGATAATLGAAASGGSTAGAATAFNADMNNRQLHPTERQLAKELAAKSGGKYTQEEIEDAMRNAGNTDKGESVIAGMTVDPKDRNAIYDTGAVWTMGENGQLVQVLPPQPPADLVAYIKANTGDTYNWYTPSTTPAAQLNVPRDRLTNLPLDEQGRYTRSVVIGGQMYQPKYHACAIAECMTNNANLDRSDPATQAYVQALHQQVLKDIQTGATVGVLVNPVGAVGVTLTVVGTGAAAWEAAIQDDPIGGFRDKGIELGSERAALTFFEKVLQQPPAAAARFVALINLAGGWEAFRERVKIDLVGAKPND